MRQDVHRDASAGVEQDVVDPQAVVLRKRELPVVPPAERLLRLVEEAEAVAHAERLPVAKYLAFGVGAQHLPAPELGLVHVAVLRRDIEVAGDHECLVPRELSLEERRGGPAPFELVAILVRVDGLAVRHVEIDDAHAGDGGRQHAFLLVGKLGQRRHHVFDCADAVAHEQRDAVVRVLAGEMRRVACRGELGARKLRVHELGFLQAHDVRARSRRASRGGAATAR